MRIHEMDKKKNARIIEYPEIYGLVDDKGFFFVRSPQCQSLANPEGLVLVVITESGPRLANEQEIGTISRNSPSK